MLVSWTYVYCYWLWMVSTIYLTFGLSFSPLISLIPAFIYTVISQLFFFGYVHITKKIFLIVVEFSFVLLVVRKSKELEPLFDLNDNYSQLTLVEKLKLCWYNIKSSIIPNILLFLIYNIYLYVNGTSFYKVYYTDLPRAHKKRNETLLQYLDRKFSKKEKYY